MICTAHINYNSSGATLSHFFTLFFVAICLITALTGCSIHPLTVQTQYLSHENLASFHIGTPDPHLDNPTKGQRLLIQWYLSKSAFEEQDLILQLQIRFHNHTEDKIQIPVTSKRGYYLYDLINDDYCKTGGVLTYLAEIRKGECVVASWKHPLWTPVISFDYDKKQE